MSGEKQDLEKKLDVVSDLNVSYASREYMYTGVLLQLTGG
jgi:hypothetical protein